MLRPGGIAYCEFPNYLWPWEQHVKLPMLPKSPKWLLALQCRATNRDPGFIDHLNFQCDPLSFRRWVRRAPEKMEIIDLMAEKVDAVFAGTEEPVMPGRAPASLAGCAPAPCYGGLPSRHSCRCRSLPA